MTASGTVPIVHPVINWSDWMPLFPTKELGVIPQEPGIYLVSHEALNGIQYVGHSRTDLRDQIRRMGYEIDSEEMPYRDPHTAAPCLWAIAEEYDVDYQVCWASIDRISGDEIPSSLTSIRTIGELATVNELVGQSPPKRTATQRAARSAAWRKRERLPTSMQKIPCHPAGVVVMAIRRRGG